MEQHVGDTDGSTQGPSCPWQCLCRRQEEQTAPDLENREDVALCFLANSSEILQSSGKLPGEIACDVCPLILQASVSES